MLWQVSQYHAMPRSTQASMRLEELCKQWLEHGRDREQYSDDLLRSYAAQAQLKEQDARAKHARSPNATPPAVAKVQRSIRFEQDAHGGQAEPP